MRMRRRALTDPALKRRLADAKGSARPVEAVLTLRKPSTGGQPTTASATQATADDVLKRVEEQVGSGATRVNVIGNLGIVVVAAPEAFLQKLLLQPEIESAAANDAD